MIIIHTKSFAVSNYFCFFTYSFKLIQDNTGQYLRHQQHIFYNVRNIKGGGIISSEILVDELFTGALMCKISPNQVPSAELEALLLTHSQILDAGVIRVPDQAAGELYL